MLDLFNSFHKELFFRKSDKILQRRQKKYHELHPIFIKWATFMPYKNIRRILINSYNKCFVYLDKVFLERFPTLYEHESRLWELFMCDFLLDRGFTLNNNKKLSGTPDILINHKGVDIWIENVCSSSGTDPSIKPLGNEVHHLDELSAPRYIRLISSFIDKSNKWNDTYLFNGASPNDPYIIAINGSQSEGFITDKGMLGVLYSIGLTQVDIQGNISYQNLGTILKHNGAKIKTGFFTSKEYSHISGVIYLESTINFLSNDMVVDNESLQFIPNINAKNPLSRDFIERLDLLIPIRFN